MASKRNPIDLLNHIEYELDWAIPHFALMNFEAFVISMPSVRAAERTMLIISEAVKNLPRDLLVNFPEIDWRAIRDSGNFLRHEYDLIDRELVWVTVTKRLPELKLAIERLKLHLGGGINELF
jgi:uncharacterized protein with HEPN domain